MYFKNILLPTDFSECSLHALPYAVEMADKFGGVLHLLNVVYDLTEPPGVVPYPASYHAMLADLEKSSLDQINKLAHTIKHPKVKTAVTRGDEDAEILKYAKANSVDLIVMGTHGRRGIEHLILGSTTEKVVRYSPVPVLTIRK